MQPETILENAKPLVGKDFETDQEVRWCPGCGDYSILKQTQTVLAQTGHTKENTVFISGIGCSSRFPYYMDTYGVHSIHGRAPAMATGLKIARPDLKIWMITGDGDALSIGGNHTIHMLRRNPDINVLLFNNQIYGLTKGQFSPTSEMGKTTKSSPMGTVDQPFNPLQLALGAGAKFVARSMDRDVKHLQKMLLRADGFKGTSFLEIYQNCNVFNDGAFFGFNEKDSKPDTVLFLEQGMPLVFGSNQNKGIKLVGTEAVVVDLNENNISKDDLWIHDEGDFVKAMILARFFDLPSSNVDTLPRPMGVLYQKEAPTYEVLVNEQIAAHKAQKGQPNLDLLLSGNETWTVE